MHGGSVIRVVRVGLAKKEGILYRQGKRKTQTKRHSGKDRASEMKEKQYASTSKSHVLYSSPRPSRPPHPRPPAPPPCLSSLFSTRLSLLQKSLYPVQSVQTTPATPASSQRRHFKPTLKHIPGSRPNTSQNQLACHLARTANEHIVLYLPLTPAGLSL
ncbi:hypothetical protein BGY98DRAFT_1051189 [Russula aff. rugulosa BPL654]|nr:hypothetical protein BGY98DRAFT_1051189 [Russula aff. rugulosa BPL654]